MTGPIAVAPFANISRDPADEWLGAGIAATVAADLSELGLAVVDSDPDGPAAARWEVTGGYQRVDGRLRITARLVELETGVVRHSIRVDGAVDEIFDLQDRVVAELTAALGVPVRPSGPPAVVDRITASPAAPVPRDATGEIVLPSPAPVSSRGVGGVPSAAAGTGGGGFGIATGAGFLTGRPSVRPARTTTPSFPP